jgi:ABC-type Fe3+/spermidine/putrescine transport system ATPase subunit
VSTNSAVDVHDLCVAEGGRSILDGVDLSLEKGSVLALLGPSGTGKTTLLRTIAGFREPDRGQVVLFGKQMTGVPPERRPVSMLFQSPVLFPQLTVEENALVGFSKGERSSAILRVRQLAREFQIDGFLNRKADERLSGGEQQRAAMMRTFARVREIVLLDEPLKSALNLELRWQLMRAIKDLAQRERLSAILVTHEFEEAAFLGQEICVLVKGKAYVGQPRDMYFNPPTLDVARVLGHGNELDAALLLDREKRERTCPIAFEGDENHLNRDGHCFFFRPSSIAVRGGAGFVIQDISFLGQFTLLALRSRDGTTLLSASVPTHNTFARGQEVAATLRASEAIAFDVFGKRL